MVPGIVRGRLIAPIRPVRDSDGNDRKYVVDSTR